MGGGVALDDLLPGFAGDLGWIHAREGHRGRPYWPGGGSGVTLDPGFDLGHAEPALFGRLYGPLLPPEGFEAARRALGRRGEEARAALEGDPALRAIRLSAAQALGLMPHTARPYWEAISRRFPALAAPGALPEAQTALLSLAYNRGPGNEGLEVLRGPLEEKDWAEAARRIGRMQQDHALAGVRRRRLEEEALILAGLGLAAPQRS